MDNYSHSEDKMVVLSNSDYFETHLASMLADYDKDLLANFYQPIIGYQGYALFLSLWSETKNQNVAAMSSHENLFLMLKMSPGEFIKARKALEAVGLLKTYLSSDGDTHLYTYVLYAPKTPAEFLNDSLLLGTLVRFAGESYVKRLRNIYLLSNSGDYGKDISISFDELYSPDNATRVIPGNYVSRKNGLTMEFSYEKFFNELGRISQISSSAINNSQMDEISRIATLNGVDELTMAKLVATAYNPHNSQDKRIDFQVLTRLCQDERNYSMPSRRRKSGVSSDVSSDSDIALKVKLMETYSPKEYLAVLQNGSKPASSDLRIVDSLSKDFHLPNCIINALVDYVLAVNNNILSKALSEKIAASLAREGIDNVLDCLNYLKKTHTNKYKKEERRVVSKKEVSNKHEEAPTEEEVEAMIDELEAMNDIESEDDNHGKA